MKTLLFAIGVLTTLFFGVNLSFGQVTFIENPSGTGGVKPSPGGTTPERISFQPDPQAGTIAIYSDPAATSCSIRGGAGTLQVYVFHIGTLAAVGAEYSAPKPACLDGTWVSDENAFPVTIGNSQTGVSIGYGTCRQSPILIQTITYFVDSDAPPCCVYPVLNHPLVDPPAMNMVDCNDNLLHPAAQTAMINETAACPCGGGEIVCAEATLRLQGYRTVSKVDPLWTVQVEVLNYGPGPARNVSAVMQQDIAWLGIPDPGCYYGDILVGESTWGDADNYVFDLTFHPGGSFNVWFDVSYEDTCGNSHLLRLDPEFDIREEPLPRPDAMTACRLGQNYPNPFNPTTTIPIYLPSDTDVRLSVVDSQGKLVRVLVREPMSAGSKEVVWDSRDGKGNLVSSGLYFCRLETPNTVDTRKLLLLK